MPTPPVSTYTINEHTYTDGDWEASPQAALSGTASDIAAVAAHVDTVSGLVHGGACVTMRRTVDSGNDPSINPATWQVYKEDGTLIDTTGSPTQGLQEAIDYMALHGLDLIVYGGMVKPASSPGAFDGTDPSCIVCSDTVVFPPIQKGFISIRDVSIISSAAIGVQFDSILNAVIDLCWGGQIVMTASGATGVEFKPRTEVPQDSGFGIGVGGTVHVRVGTVALSDNTGTCISFDRSSGQFGFGGTWIFSELNGGANGAVVRDGTHAFANQDVKIYACHGQTVASLQIVETITGGGDVVVANRFYIDAHPGTGGVGLATFARDNNYTVSVDGAAGTPATGVKFETSATDEVVDALRIVGCTVKVQDVSTARSNIVRQGGVDYVLVDINGSDQNGIASNTWTKLSLDHLPLSTKAHFDTTANRYTPGIAGLVSVKARAAWVAMTDQSPMFIGIYKNGSLHFQVFAISAAVTGGQGPNIAIDVMMDNDTDYLEIFVRQDSGSPKSISGAIAETWATFTRL